MPLASETNIYTPRQRYLLLIATLVVLGLLAFYGILNYLTAFLGAGILLGLTHEAYFRSKTVFYAHATHLH